MVKSLLVVVVALAVVLGAAWLVGGRTRAKRARDPFAYRPRSPWLRRLPILLLVAAVAFLVVGLAQFRLLRDRSTPTVMLVMDVSETMDRTDVEPNRLEAAKGAARVFLDRLPDEVDAGLVTFADEVVVVAPPTSNRTEVVSAVDRLPRGVGTLLGDGLGAALDGIEAELQDSGDAPAAVVLLSDGQDCGLSATQCPESKDGTPIREPRDASARTTEAVDRAAELGIQVYTVMLGDGEQTEGRADALALLEGIAESTGGDAFTADTSSGLIEVYETLESRISSDLEVSDFGALFVATAALLALAAAGAMVFALRPQY